MSTTKTIRRKKRYILNLEGIIPKKILERYHIEEPNYKEIEQSVTFSKPSANKDTLKDIVNARYYTYGSDLYKEYPKQTKSHCYWCRCPFESKPIGVPVKYRYDDKEKQHIFWMEGYACNFKCCKRLIQQELPFKRHYEGALANLRLLYSLSYGINIDQVDIPEADDWNILDIYNHEDGVGIGIDEFRNGNINYKSTHNIVFVPCGTYYESYES